MTLEVRIPISPTPAFVNRTNLILRSIREFYPDALAQISVGFDHGGRIDDAAMRLLHIEGASCRVVPQPEFARWAGTRSPYLATMMDRYKPPFHGDHILMLDADVICLRRFDELFAFDGLQGMMTHVPPFNKEVWSILFQALGIDGPHEWHSHSAAGIMCRPDAVAPPYFNSGMVFGPRWAFKKIADPSVEAIEFLRRAQSDTYWFDQVGLALAMARAEVPTKILPMRWNFANQRSFEDVLPEEAADIRFLHFMREDYIDRTLDFLDDSTLRALVSRRDLVGTDALLQRRIAALTPDLQAVAAK